MATNEENLNLIAEIEKEIIDNEQFTLQEYKEQIILLETAKERFQEPAAVLDRALYKQVAEVNNKRDELSNAYKDRLENGCKTDLFWRVVGITSRTVGDQNPRTYYRYNLKCEKLSTYFFDNSSIISEFPSNVGIATGILSSSNSSVISGIDTSGLLVGDEIVNNLLSINSTTTITSIGSSTLNISPNHTFTGGSITTDFSFFRFITIENPPIDNIEPFKITRATEWDEGLLGTGKLIKDTIITVEQVAGGKLKMNTNPYAELENKNGLKLYTEPYTKDLIDTFVAESYGIISLGSNKITLLSPFEGDINNIEGGNIVTCEPNPFSPELSATVASIATTSIDLGGFNTTITGGINTSTDVPYITVDLTSNFDLTQLPLDGSTPYPLFQFSISPNEIDEEDFSVDFETSPYTPQTIKILEFESIEKANQEINGNGIRIQRTDDGYDTTTATWDKFLEGFPNPNNLDVTVEEPLVSAGQQFYVLGFDERPLKQNGDPASEGDLYSIDTGIPFLTYPDNGLYENLPSCSTDLNNAVSDAITAKDNAVSAWNDTNNNVSARITLSNLLKDEINYLNLRIWSLRMQLGESKKTIKTKEDFNEEIIKSGLLDLLNNPDEL